MTGKRFILLAAAAGLAAAGIDLAGKTGDNLFWGALELLCGMTAGCGAAALWMQQKYTLPEKFLLAILFLCHILSVWMWIPFAFGLLCRDSEHREPDAVWGRRVFFTAAAILCTVGGFGLFYWGWSAPQPDIPLLQTLAGLLAAALAPGLLARYILRIPAGDAWRLQCRFLALLAALLLLCSLAKLRYRPAEEWYIYAGLLLIFAGTAALGWRKKIASGNLRTVRNVWYAVLCLTAGHMALDCRLDRVFFGTRRQQQWQINRFYLHSPPILTACRNYRTKYQTWPERPEQLAEFFEKKTAPYQELLITGCYTDSRGDFRILLKRPLRRLVMAYCFGADGTEKWEIIAPDHPLFKPGDRRWKHRFPHTD